MPDRPLTREAIAAMTPEQKRAALAEMGGKWPFEEPEGAVESKPLPTPVQYRKKWRKKHVEDAE